MLHNSEKKIGPYSGSGNTAFLLLCTTVEYNGKSDFENLSDLKTTRHHLYTSVPQCGMRLSLK